MARIVVVTDCLQSLMRRCGFWLRRLVEQDHRVSVAAPRRPGETEALRRFDGIDQWRISLQLDGGLATPRADSVRSLQRLFEHWNPEVLLGDGAELVVRGLVAAWLADQPVRYAVLKGADGVDNDAPATWSFLVQMIASMLYGLGVGQQQWPAFLSRDAAYLRCARRLVGGCEQLALIDTIAVDLETYRPVALPDELSFLFCGRFTDSSGVVEFVEAARRIRAHHGSVTFLLAGWPEEGPDAIDSGWLRGWIEEGDVEYLGHLDDRRDAIAEASVYVAPGQDRWMPPSVPEAMAMGRPVVISEPVNCREAVQHGDNGFVVQPGCVESLARAMTHFVGEPALRRAMGACSRRIAATQFDARSLSETLSRVLEVGPPTDLSGLQPGESTSTTADSAGQTPAPFPADSTS